MDDLVALVKGAHNGTEVHNIDGYDDLQSLTPMWEQVTNIKAKMLPIMQQAKDGINLICFSQGESKAFIVALSLIIYFSAGGLVCRGILETTPEHNVHTFVSLSSPQAGQFGGTVLECVFIRYVTTFLQILSTSNISSQTSPRTIFMSE